MFYIFILAVETFAKIHKKLQMVFFVMLIATNINIFLHPT